MLLAMIDDMIRHYKADSLSLIARIYGVFTIKTNVFDEVDVMII